MHDPDDDDAIALPVAKKKLAKKPDFKIVDDCVVATGNLRDWIFNNLENVIGWSTLHRLRGKYPIALLAANIQLFEDADGSRKKLVDLIRERSKVIEANAWKRLDQGKALLDDLIYYFSIGTEVIVGRGDNAVGGIVTAVSTEESMMGRYLKVSFSMFANVTGSIVKVVDQGYVGDQKELFTLTRLNVRRITADEKAVLAARGAMFCRYGTTATNASYSGSITQPSWGGDRHFRADGRVMIDPKAMRTVEPNLYSSFSRAYGKLDSDDDDCCSDADDDNDDNAPTLTAVAPDEQWMCTSYLLGFSFSAKQWGKLKVTGLADIEWRDDAFDKLVLPSEDKDVVRALVEHNQGAFADIIDGKGGGTIFLLHGEPGQGKTLLAETTAELLHRPLYMISVGELGVSPDILEERLREILDLASAWNAVLLLDEADIFLEERNEQDIVRNAMVGVFLRLLEYHQGVLFLTTNRVRNIDRAFFSRISVAFSFGKADTAKLKAIWTNLLLGAGVGGIDVDHLSETYSHVNGRQIKNSIRLAQTIAKSQNTQVTIDHIIRTIDLGTKFVQEFAADKA